MRVRPIPLSRAQIKVLDSTSWLTGMTGGRNAGKSRVGATWIHRKAKKDWPCLCVGPNDKHVKDTSFATFIECTRYTGQYLKDVTTPWPKVTFRTANDDGVATIQFRGSHDPESLRGPNIAMLWFDEASLQALEAYQIGIGMCRFQRRLSPVLATFTPKGLKHWTFDKFFEPIHESEREKFGSKVLEIAGKFFIPRKMTNLIHCRTRDNPFSPADYVDVIGANYSTMLREQELEGLYLEIAGLMFQRANFKSVDQAPAECIRFRYWDKASTPGDGCFSAGALVAKDRLGRIFIEHIIRGQWSPAQRNEVMKQIAEQDFRRYNGTVTTYIEREGAGSGGEINTQLITMLGKYPVYSDSCMISTRLVDGVKLPGDAKIRRAMPLAGQVENGNVYIVQGDFVPDFLDEACMFPEYVFADQVDAVAACYNKLALLPSDAWQAQRYTVPSEVEHYGRVTELSDGGTEDYLRSRLPWNR
jgi:predicted phage terminase large subunit-like protein